MLTYSSLSFNHTFSMTNVKKQIVDEIYKPLRKRFKRRSTVQKGRNDTWQADLTILDSISKYNQGYKYLLCVIDIFTKFAYIKPLKTKTGREVSEALEEIFIESKVSPKNLHTDQGTEFFNPQVKKLLERYDVNLYHTHTKMKAAIVERFQRTFKTRLFKMFAYKGSYKYIDDLQNLIDNYNNTPHRALNGMKPNSIKSKAKERLLLSTVYNRIKIFTPGRFKVGDYVRIADYKGVFDKGYEPNFSTAIFTVTKVKT